MHPTDSPAPPADDARRADALGVSTEALTLCRDLELIDLHLDTFIPVRLWGYDVFAPHKPPFGGHFFGHLDLPRMIEGGLSGGMWSITTNPFRTAGGRLRTFQRNLTRFRAMVQASGGQLAFARTAAEYRAVRATGAHAVMLAIQGGNALDAAPDGPAAVPDRLLTRVTLVHLTNAKFGATSSPGSKLRRDRGLSDAGRAFVEQCDAERVFVDLAHIHPDAFWHAVEAHDPSLPLIVTHTGVDGVRPHWRNLDDRQIKAIADSGGVVGVMAHRGFLGRKDGPRDGAMIVEHMEHIIEVAGEEVAALGTDYDGAISPPVDMKSGERAYPRLVQHMLDRRWTPDRIRRVLADNFLDSFARLRPS